MKKILQTAVRHEYSRLAILSAAAAAVAYGVGGTTVHISAVVAGLTALISVRPTFHDTVAETLRQVFGTLLGAAFALVLTHLMGYSPGALFLMILGCFALGRLLRLGEEGAAAMGVTVILIVGPTFDPDLVEARFLGVVLGTAVALVASLWVRPGKPHTRALAESVARAQESAGLLTEMSSYLGEHQGRVGKKVAKKWVLAAENTMTELGVIRKEAQSALKSAQWSPLVNKNTAQSVLEQIIIAQVSARMSYSIARDLMGAARHPAALPASAAETLSGVLGSTAQAIAAQAELARKNPAATLPLNGEEVDGRAALRGQTVHQIRRLDETQSILLVGSLLRDTDKITDTLYDTQPIRTIATALPPEDTTNL